MKSRLTLVAAPLFAFALQANAQCPAAFPAVAPTIPNGATASAPEMLEAQTAVQNFVETGEAYLECRSFMLTHRYNRYLDDLVDVSERFNEELASFQGREAIAGA